MRLFRSTFGDGVTLEVRKGTKNHEYAAVKIELGRLPQKELGNVLMILDRIVQQVER